MHLKNTFFIKLSFFCWSPKSPLKFPWRSRTLGPLGGLQGTSPRRRVPAEQLVRLKLVSFIYAPVRRHKDVSNRSDEFICQLIYQLRRHRDVSAWSGAFRLVTKIDQFLLRTISVNFLGVSGGSFSLRYQLVRCYNVSKTSFSFRYQL